MNALDGWTMKFAPYGMFLPLHSIFLILEQFYRDAIGRAIGAEVAGLPASNIVNVVLGSIGKQSGLAPELEFPFDAVLLKTWRRLTSNVLV